MVAEAETPLESILSADEGLGMGRDRNAPETKTALCWKCAYWVAAPDSLMCDPCAQGKSTSATLPRHWFDNPPLHDVLCAEDVRAARLDRDGFGRVHPEIKFAVALQVLRSIATEQIGASAAVKALAVEALKVCE